VAGKGLLFSARPDGRLKMAAAKGKKSYLAKLGCAAKRDELPVSPL
jgi:hypothetical protein